MQDLFTPLTDNEIEQLEDFLLNRIDDDVDTTDKDEGIFEISSLDGFFTAIISGPTMISPSQWLPAIWGDFEPVWKDEKEMEQILSLMMRHMNGIASTLMEQPQDFEPIFLERMVDEKTFTIVDEWCEGYMRGVVLAAEQWHLNELKMKVLLGPMMAFNGEEAIRTHDSFNQQEIENIQKAITPNAREIHAYWLARREEVPDQLPHRHTEPRVGRNDPCPCGSGKKYKKCCLH